MAVFLRKLACRLGTLMTTPKVAAALVVVSREQCIGHGLPEDLAGFGSGCIVIMFPDISPFF